MVGLASDHSSQCPRWFLNFVVVALILGMTMGAVGRAEALCPSDEDGAFYLGADLQIPPQGGSVFTQGLFDEGCSFPVVEVRAVGDGAIGAGFVPEDVAGAVKHELIKVSFSAGANLSGTERGLIVFTSGPKGPVPAVGVLQLPCGAGCVPLPAPPHPCEVNAACTPLTPLPPPPPSVTCSDVLFGAVNPAILDGGHSIGAIFIPNSGLSLTEAASLCGYHHFNWIQWLIDGDVFRTPTPFQIIQLVGAGVTDQFGQIPTLPFVDPPRGGYEYERRAEGIGDQTFPAADDVAGYLDEEFGLVVAQTGAPCPALSSAVCVWKFLGRGDPGTDLALNTGARELTFFDKPSGPFGTITFLTCLAGVRTSGSVEEISGRHDCFKWTYQEATNSLVNLIRLSSPPPNATPGAGTVALIGFEDPSPDVVALIEDVVPATTKAMASPSPNSQGWNNANVTVALSADDTFGGSGVRQINSSLNGAPLGAAMGSTASVSISTEGVSTLSYFSTDNAGNQEALKTLTVRIDKTPPVTSCKVTPHHIWPPNNKLVPVTASVSVTDALSGPAGFVLVSVSNSENEAKHRREKERTDIRGFVPGTPSVTGFLQAEHPGQVYTLTYRGTDLAGNSSTCQVTVKVEDDRHHHRAGKDSDHDGQDR